MQKKLLRPPSAHPLPLWGMVHVHRHSAYVIDKTVYVRDAYGVQFLNLMRCYTCLVNTLLLLKKMF